MSRHFAANYKMRKCESAKVNMCKLRKCDAKYFAFYTSPSRVIIIIIIIIIINVKINVALSENASRTRYTIKIKLKLRK